MCSPTRSPSAHEQARSAHEQASSDTAPPSQADLLAIVEELAAVSLQLDRAGQGAADGVVTMSLDVASQAVHLALVELQDCLVDA